MMRRAVSQVKGRTVGSFISRLEKTTLITVFLSESNRNDAFCPNVLKTPKKAAFTVAALYLANFQKLEFEINFEFNSIDFLICSEGTLVKYKA